MIKPETFDVAFVNELNVIKCPMFVLEWRDPPIKPEALCGPEAHLAQDL